MELVMDTDNARTLATSFGGRSDRALSLRDELIAQLEAAAMDDIYGVSDSLSLLSEELHTGDVVLRHQADIMDGLTIDVDQVAQDLGVERWQVEQQLRNVEAGDIEAGEAVIALVDWAAYDIVGPDTTIRDFIPDLPPPGEDPELDALIQRLDGWYLSMVIDERPLSPSVIDAARQADLMQLGEYFDMIDPADAMTQQAFHVDRFPHDREDDRTRVEYRSVPLPTSEYGTWMADWIRGRLIAERKLTRVGAVPTIGELFDFTTYQEAYEQKKGGGDEDYETKYRTKERKPEEIAEEIARVNAEFKGIDWLPAVLLGRAAVPENVARNRVMQNQLFKLAKRFGFPGDGTTLADGVPDPDLGERALAYLRDAGRDRLVEVLENPRPVQKARLPFSEGGLDASIELGRQQGVVTAEAEAQARLIALHLTGSDVSAPGFDIDADLDPEALAAEASELDVNEFVALLASTIPPHQLTEQRLYQALSHVQRAGTVAERVAAIEQAVLGLTTVATAGEPAMTTHQWLSTLPDEVRAEQFDVDIQGEEFNWILEHVGIPGYHKSRDWRRGKGKRYFHLVNDGQGATDDFVVERIPKKQGWFGQAVMTVAKVAISIYIPPLGAAIAAMDAAMAATKGDWLGAGLGALGAVAAGAAAWAATTSASAATASSAADALAKTSRSIDAISSANTVANAANATAEVAKSAANVALAVKAGAHAGVAFSDGDILGGVVNTVTAVGAGATGFGYDGVGQVLGGGARVIGAVDRTIDAIEGDDVAGAIAGGLNAGSALVNLATPAPVDGDVDVDPAAESMARFANSLDDLAGVVRTGGNVIGAIEDDAWGAVVGDALRFGSSTARLVGNPGGAVSGVDLDPGAGAASGDQPNLALDAAGWLDAAADLADSGVAFAEGDHLGGTALLASGTTGFVRDGSAIEANLERLDNLATLANKLMTAPPGMDHATAMGLLGAEMHQLLGSFAPAVEPRRTGSARQQLDAVRAERQGAEAGLRTLDGLLALDGTDGTVGALLGTMRTDMTDELERLRQEESRAIEFAHQERARLQAQAQAAAQAGVTTLPAGFTGRGVGGPPGGAERTPEEELTRQGQLKHLAAVEAHMFALRDQIHAAPAAEHGPLLREYEQYRLRREGLRLLLDDPSAGPEDFAQFDGTRHIIDSTTQGFEYYYDGGPGDLSGPHGPRTPVVLGPGSREGLMNAAEVQAALDELMAGGTPTAAIRLDEDGIPVDVGVPAVGYVPVNRTFTIDDLHLGRTVVGYDTRRNDDGTLTTTFTFNPFRIDGFKDVRVPSMAPSFVDEWMGADGLGPGAEREGGRPYLYEPFSWEVHYPDHGLELAPPGVPSHLPGPPRPVDGRRSGLDERPIIDAFAARDMGLTMAAPGATLRPSSFDSAATATVAAASGSVAAASGGLDGLPLMPAHLPTPPRPPHLPSPPRPVSQPPETAQPLRLSTEATTSGHQLAPTRQRAFLDSLEQELDDWTTDELTTRAVPEHLGAGERRTVETDHGHRYQLTPLGNGLVEVDYGNSRQIFQREGIRRAIDDLRADLDNPRLRGGAKRSRSGDLHDLEELMTVADAPPAPVSFRDEPVSTTERFTTLTNGYLETSTDDPNEFELVGSEVEGLGMRSRFGAFTGDTDDTGFSYAGSLAEFEFGQEQVKLLNGEVLLGSVRRNGVEISGANAGLTVAGATNQSRFGIDSGGVDEPEWGQGLTAGPGFGFTIERGDGDGDGRRNTRVNINVGGGNINRSWEVDETHYEGLMPGSRPFYFHPETGAFEPQPR
ncbi:MAG: hypothetical protein AAGE88_15410 [Actinomycetota bacterium]